MFFLLSEQVVGKKWQEYGVAGTAEEISHYMGCVKGQGMNYIYFRVIGVYCTITCVIYVFVCLYYR